MAGPLNYSTKVPAERTAAECATILGRHGVNAVQTTYENGQPVGLAFTQDGRAYALPIDAARMSTLLASEHRRGRLSTKHVTKAVLLSDDHALAVAWRVVKDWLEAQMALVAAQQVEVEDVMLPYLLLRDGRPLRAHARENIAALTGGGAS